MCTVVYFDPRMGRSLVKINYVFVPLPFVAIPASAASSRIQTHLSLFQIHIIIQSLYGGYFDFRVKEICFFCYFLHHSIHLMTEKDIKSCFSIKKLILTSKRHAEHQFAGQNTQQCTFFVCWHDLTTRLFFILAHNSSGRPLSTSHGRWKKTLRKPQPNHWSIPR